MKNNKKITSFAVGGALFAFAAALLINYNLEKNYKYGDYVKEEDAYFVEKIDDEAGLIKAEKYIVPTDNKYNDQKSRSMGTNLIGDIESVWSSYTGAGTTIAIIDDGFDYNHPEYTRSDGSNAILATSRYYYSNGYTAYYKSYSDDPTCIAEDWESDGYGGYEWASHGTATSTTAAAPMNNGGGVGIAPGADILALKIDFSFAAIEGAINYAVAQKVDVINMSLGAYAETFTDGWGDKQTGRSDTATYLDSVCQKAFNAGIIVVAAAGNEATYRKSYPACNTKVIGVGAIGDYDNKGNANALAEFTNYVGASQTGEINVDILAPGYVYTAHQGGTQSNITHGYDDTQGTSFSSPIVAGAAALWKEKYPSGTPTEFLSQLQNSADGIGTYTNKMVPVSGWGSKYNDAGPSNITNGRVNVANLLDINNPYVTTVQENLNITVGEKKQITLSSSNGTITYSSNNSNIATISSSGLVEGKNAGTTSITVTAIKDGESATATVGVNVAPVFAATSISFNPASVTLNVGETYNAEEQVIVTPSNASRIFLFDSSNPSVATVNEDTGLVTAVSTGTAEIEVIAIHGVGYDSLAITVNNAIPKNGLINFGNGTGNLAVGSFSVTGNDSLQNSWLVTTTGGAATHFGQNADYSQIGSGNNPASAIEFKMTLSSAVTFTSVSAAFGGFNGSKATVVIKVGTTQIGSGSVSGTADRTTTSSSSAAGTTLIISLSGVQKGIKVYSISYTYIGEGGGTVTPPEPTLENVGVSVKNNKTFHPGEVIIKNDISVTLTYSDGNKPTTTNFTFASDGYMFTYEDANSGGANTSKLFSITYEGESYNFSVNVTRAAYQAATGSSKTLGSTDFNSSNLSKSIDAPSNSSVEIGGIDFIVTTNAYVFSQSGYFLSFGKNAGSIINKHAFSADLTAVSVTQKSGARQDGVLSISKNSTSWVTYSSSEVAKGGYRYFKYAYTGIGGSGASGYSNIQSISYTLSGQDSPKTVANYIMYQDTDNQCVTKLPLAIVKLNSMTSANKSAFWTSNDYVIATARERILAWARHEGHELTYTNDSFQISSANNISTLFSDDNKAEFIPLAVVLLFGFVALGGYYFLKRKKES